MSLFIRLREPSRREAARIGLLESLVARILPGFFGEGPLPACRVITSDRAVWRGAANYIRLSSPQPTPWGLKVFYRLPYVALKQWLLAALTCTNGHTCSAATSRGVSRTP